MKRHKWVIKQRVPDQVYTDRKDLLDYYFKAALETAHRRSMSGLLLGYRRMGKTEIFRRVVNKLFFEQDRLDPNAVVPVYYSFSDKQAQDERLFAIEYLENFMRYYVGFYTQTPELIREDLKDSILLERIKSLKKLYPFRRTFDLLFLWYDQIVSGCVFPAKDALSIPRRVADIDDTSIVVFLDEFQNTRLPHFNFDVAGYYQDAADSNTCPHFVTGSAMSMLSMDIIGRGALFGRFDFDSIAGMSNYHGTQLALRSAAFYHAQINEFMSPVIAERCGGNPFYITAVIKQSAKLNTPIFDIDILDDILAVDISSGFIWGELCDQVNRWIERINQFNLTKWILYFASLADSYDSQTTEIDVPKIKHELKDREGIDVEIKKIRDILVLLSRGDLIEYHAGSFFKNKDPILCDFLKVWGKIEIENMPREQVRLDLQKEYYQLINKRSLNEYKGYLGEVHMSQVLLASQKLQLSGDFFNADTEITMPVFSYVRHRVRLSSGYNREIDLLGAGFKETWVCQSKWLETSKVGIGVLKNLMAQAQAVHDDIKPLSIKKWIFAHNGLTHDAETFAKNNHIYWSDRRDLDSLLKKLNLRALYSLTKK